MTSIVRFFQCDVSRTEPRSFLFVAYALVFVSLLTGNSSRFDGRREATNGGSSSILLVEGFSLVPPSSLPPSRSPFSLGVQRQPEAIILDDPHSSTNATVHYSDLIDIISDAQYMDTETKSRFIESLNDKISSISKGIGAAHAIETKESSHNSAPTDGSGEEHCGDEIMAKTKIDAAATKTTNGSLIPTIEVSWEDDGGPFRASGAWQNTPLLMKGAFVDDIQNLGEDDIHPFPSWEEIVELACDPTRDHDHQNDHHGVPSQENFDDDENEVGEYGDGDGDGDGYDNHYDMWDGDDDDDDDDFPEDGDEGFYLWDDGSQFQEDEDDGDNPPSRLIQYWWPRQENPNYHDVNTNWLDTFDIKQFGPFNDPDSLESLLRTEDEPNSERQTSRTLLVNDVDRWFPKLSDWMDRRFNGNKFKGGVLPARWRRDDAQISLSYPMGGIGPHVDDYDVFLIQLEGERTWDVLWEEAGSNVTGPYTSKISVREETDCILPESSMNGVRILNVTKLQSFKNDRTTLTRLHLRPGDCLYLPPRVLHCGTAIEASENCMTLSVGCRAPSALELLNGLSDLMEKSATMIKPQAMDSAGSTFPSDVAIQAFHKRYTNSKIGSDKSDKMSNDRASGQNNGSPLQSSWLSPQVKGEMKNLVLKAVQTALDDDENILDPLVGRFVTKSNRLAEEDFGLGDDDGSLQTPFSYPKSLRGILNDDERQDEGEGDSINIWGNATATLIEVFGAPKLTEESGDCFLRRAEGISFAWSSVYDKEQQTRKYRLYAQGRPPFEVLETPLEGTEEDVDNPNKLFVSAPSSALARLMDRIANGPPLNRAFVVDELQIPIDLEQKGTRFTTTRLLFDLVEEGLLYGGYCNPEEV